MDPLVLAVSSEVALRTVAGDVGDQVEVASALLTDAERGRAAAFMRAEDRRDFVAAHTLARLCAGRVLGRRPDELTLTQRCDECGGPHGRPVLAEAPDLGLSFSHARGQLAAAAGEGKIGVDVEGVARGSTDPSMWRLALAAREIALVSGAADPGAAFLRQWVRKEALIKVAVCSMDTLTEIDLADLPLEAGESRWQGWHLLDWADAAGGTFGAAVAAGGTPRLGTL